MPSLSRAAGRQAGLSQLGDERWEHRGATRGRSYHCQELSAARVEPRVHSPRQVSGVEQ